MPAPTKAPTANPPRHPVARAVARLEEVLDELTETPMWSMDPDETRATLVALTRLAARVGEVEARVAGHADTLQVGDRSGATSTATWWAHATGQTRAEAHRKIRLAAALTHGHDPVRVALAAGDLLVDQARVIIDAVQALPAQIEPAAVDKAEAYLVEQARILDARGLRRLGRGLLQVIAPDAADAHEAKLLDREEREAEAAVRLTLTDDGHGKTHIRGVLPTMHAAMWRKALLALAAPKHRAAVDGSVGERRPGPERLGRALCEYIERYPVDRLPQTGGLAATAVVLIPLETLQGGPSAARLDTGEAISPGLARRLACQAGIIPAVLGGHSEVLDIGRTRRFHTRAQRIAKIIEDGGCTADGCDWPPGLCHVHHTTPWSQGGPTNTRDARLLCPRHHARAHDPAYTTTKLPQGRVAFTRRT